LDCEAQQLDVTSGSKICRLHGKGLDLPWEILVLRAEAEQSTREARRGTRKSAEAIVVMKCL